MEQLLSKLCTPNADYIRDPKERNLVAFKTKSQIILYVSIIIFATFQLFQGIHPPVALLAKIFGLSLLLVILLLCCRSHLHIYFTFMTIFLVVIPTIAALKGETFFTAGGVFLCLLYLYVATDTWHYYVPAGIVYLFNLNYFIRPNIEKNAYLMTPEEFSEKLASALSVQVCIVMGFLAPIHIAKKKLNSALWESKMEAEGSLSHYKTFLLSFSHEIRNPINILLGSIELALQENLPASVFEAIQTAKISSEILLQLINNVLDVGKAEVGKLEIVPTPTRVHDQLLRMWNISSELIKKKGLSGYLKISRELPLTIKIDPDRLNQVLLNLIGNAVKFAQKGTINLTVDWLPDNSQVTPQCFGEKPFDEEDEGVFDKNEAFSVLGSSRGQDPGYLHHYYVLSHLQKKNSVLEKLKTEALSPLSPRQRSMRQNKGVLRITVKDQGCGMSQRAMSGLFKKFYQCNEEAGQRKIGTGLGLYITKDICESMGGEIKVYSKEGIGSVFIACLQSEEIETQY